MNICANCFNDEEIQMTIRNNYDIGDCELCGTCNVPVADLDEFDDFFVELLSLFKKDENGLDVVSIIQQDWNFFSENRYAESVLGYFLSKNREKLNFHLEDKVQYLGDINRHTDKWEDLKDEIRKQTRFYSSLLAYFDNNAYLLRANQTLEPGAKYYRARIIPSGKISLGREEMGCPPFDKATAGRANPVGIPYLYLCKSKDTTLYETRSVYLDKVAIGTFTIKNNLNILDFTTSISLYLAYLGETKLIDAIAQYKFLQKISSDLSKPLRRYDTELEYVPTQSICEYCKLRKIDGIIFRSSLHKDGYNLVLFDEKNAECMNVDIVEVKQVVIYT